MKSFCQYFGNIIKSQRHELFNLYWRVRTMQNSEDKLITFVVKIAYLFNILHDFISHVMWNSTEYQLNSYSYLLYFFIHFILYFVYIIIVKEMKKT